MLPTHAPLPDVLAPLMLHATVATINPRTGANGHGLPLLCGDHLDLLDLATRAEVLAALADFGDFGHRRPWMLGVIWSSLTDHQAARCCAAALQAVAEGRKPPRTVLGAWAVLPVLAPAPVGQERFGRSLLAGDHAWAEVRRHPEKVPHTGAMVGWRVSVGCDAYDGPDGGEDARERADAVLGVRGALLIGVDL